MFTHLYGLQATPFTRNLNTGDILGLAEELLFRFVYKSGKKQARIAIREFANGKVIFRQRLKRQQAVMFKDRPCHIVHPL